MIIGIPRETCPGESRVSLVPQNVSALVKKGRSIIIESGAGEAAGHTDQAYQDAGATIADRKQVFEKADIIIQVQTPGLNKKTGEDDLADLASGKVLVGMMDPLANPEFAKTLADKKVTGIAMELIPRITRAQAMDVLSSNAMIAGYKAVLIGASELPSMFPMNMTAAGTLNPARVFIMGVGVAGLQACATAKRLGGVVEAYDVRPAAREQILSVGAKPVELNIQAEDTESSGGYAKEQSAEFIKAQQAAMADVLAQQDVVITTAAVPGKKSPILVTAEMVKSMKPGSVIIDLAAEKGGNCELTKLGEVVIENGVKIIGPNNLTATVPTHASQMYGKNIENLLNLLITEDGNLNLDFEDEIVRETVVSNDGDVTNARMRDLLGMEALPVPETNNDEAANS
ncbi:Re/Si-specific NAD(P)(+) transhydrogenase subunit alpha [Aestuariicella sp. G3-2]|uniref:Re/Si-specific NAD(P)(+) transhydrogenase subunit alpha n=1 Tax=Pseudomaricurvus albidus TaxID=2842452 RepID=UPI001C0C2282|nr:Re/Si-specific NAD(P)(+) transhydrogenase subunit alpha [Aestuariicella albida]